MSSSPSYIKLLAYVDGASRGNPGPASVGVSLCEPETEAEIATVSLHIGDTTNNVSEYTALLEALKKAIEMKCEILHVKTDSQLMVRQIQGQYKVKSPHLKILFAEVKTWIAKFNSFSIEHIRREFNTRADELANLALDNL